MLCLIEHTGTMVRVIGWFQDMKIENGVGVDLRVQTGVWGEGGRASCFLTDAVDYVAL